MRRIGLAVAAIAVSISTACATNPTPTPTVAQLASRRGVAQKNPILTVLLDMIYAVDTARIPAADASKVMAVLRAAVFTLEDVPSGGYQLASDAVDQASKVVSRLSPESRAVLEPHLVAARASLETLRDQG